MYFPWDCILSSALFSSLLDTPQSIFSFVRIDRLHLSKCLQPKQTMCCSVNFALLCRIVFRLKLSFANNIQFRVSSWLFAPLSLLTSIPVWIITLPHVLYALQTLTCCLFLVFTLTLPPVALLLQYGIHFHLAFVTLPPPTLSVTFLKPTASRRPSAPTIGSPKCHRLTLCTLKIRLLTYLHKMII